MKKFFLWVFIFLWITLPVLGLEKNKSYYGKASWYGEKFHGRKTASGELYDMNKMTAAHRELPFGTIIRVTNLANNKSVEVKINDRGPFVQGRIVDVSKKAAEELGFIKTGITDVKIEILSFPGEQNTSELNTSEGKNKEIKDLLDKSSKENTKKDITIQDDADIDAIINSLKSEDLNKIEKNEKEEPNKIEQPLKEKQNIEKKEEIVEKPMELSIKKESDYQLEKEKISQLFYIQMGAFTNEKKAREFQKVLRSQGYETILIREESEDGVWFKIREKTVYRQFQTVKESLLKMRSKGIECFLIANFF